MSTYVGFCANVVFQLELVHLDYGKDVKVLLTGANCTVSLPSSSWKTTLVQKPTYVDTIAKSLIKYCKQWKTSFSSLSINSS